MNMNKELLEILTGFKRAWVLVSKKEQLLLLFTSVLMIITGFLTNLPAVYLGRFVDQISDNTSFSFYLATPFVLIIAIIILIREALTVVRKYIVHKVATQTEKNETVFVIQKLLEADMTFINAQQIGSLHGRVLRSLQGLVRLIRLSFQDFLPIVFSGFAAIALALYQKPLMAGIMILVIPTGLFIIFKQISSQKGIRVALLRGKEKIDGTVVEMLGGLETVRVSGTTLKEILKVDQITENLKLKEIKHHLAMALFDGAKQLNDAFFYILVISIAIYFASIGIITKGDILVYAILFVSITAPLKEVHRILDQAHESSILVNDLYQLINQPQDISFLSNRLTPVKSINNPAGIDIANLSFSYPNSSLEVLKNLNLNIKAGEDLGVAGASGCGKSTFVKILLRLIHNYTGEVKILDQNLKDLSRDEISKKIAYVPQKPYIFSGTILENVIYGNEDKKVSEQKVIEVIRMVNLYDEIFSSLGGLNGKVNESGNNLSGGQKQRIALARLLLKEPEILILDEATSALDNINEEIVLRNIETRFRGRILIIIAHRLTTLKSMDRILVFDNGKIVQQGTYPVLSKSKGLFRKFLEQQV